MSLAKPYPVRKNFSALPASSPVINPVMMMATSIKAPAFFMYVKIIPKKQMNKL
jgi:hypothetical protein